MTLATYLAHHDRSTHGVVTKTYLLTSSSDTRQGSHLGLLNIHAAAQCDRRTFEPLADIGHLLIDPLLLEFPDACTADVRDELDTLDSDQLICVHIP